MATAFLPSDTYTYRVRKIYQDDVEYINALFLNEARVGVMFRDEERIADSVYAFNRRGDIKQNYHLIHFIHTVCSLSLVNIQYRKWQFKSNKTRQKPKRKTTDFSAV